MTITAVPAVDRAIARRAFGQIRLTALVWGAVFGATAAASALSYTTSFPTAASRAQIAATTGRDSGLAVLLGPVAQIGTVGGYTVYKCFAFLTTIGAIWALLAATRMLRGEEDSGRWQLLLTGPTRPAQATAATLVAIAGGIAVLFVVTTAVVLLAGRNHELQWGIGQAATYASSLAIAPAVFGAAGAVTSQLGRTRRIATELGLATIGIAFVLRMIADTGPRTHWLLWSTPFGWTERMRPFVENDFWPLLPAAAAAVVLCVTATALAARRDTGAGVVSSRDVAPPRSAGLRSPLGLSVRLELPSLLAWFAGAIATALTLGVIAKIAVGSLSDSVRNLFDRFDVRGAFLDQYLGISFLFVATVVALLPAAQISATSADETSGRLVRVLSGPTGRAAFFAGRLLISAVAVTASAAAAGAAMWVGTAAQGLPVSVGALLGAGLNVVPTALVALGLGALVLASAPRAATAATYAVVVGSLILDLVASTVSSVGGVRYLSLFHYLRLAPAVSIDGQTTVTTVAVALVLCALATVVFSRRDVATG